MSGGEKARDDRSPAGPCLSPAQRQTFELILRLLARERASVSSVTDDRAWKVHVADSLTGLEFTQLRNAARIADVGSGAGFPGLILAVALPQGRVDLIEAVGRKCEFIQGAVDAGAISNARVINARSEEWARGEGREAYEAVTARAVGRLSTLAELASPLLSEDGVLVAWKGRRDEEEEAQLARAAPQLGMHPEGVLSVGPYAGSRHRHLHLIRKRGDTPADLPRRPGMAKKRPRG